MLADHFVFAIVKFRLGRLKRPTELAVCGGLTGIDLRPRGMRVQDNFFACGCVDAVRNVGWNLVCRSISGLRICERNCKSEESKPDDGKGS
jgi:putative lipase involved disintegration of autophagic bodies